MVELIETQGVLVDNIETHVQSLHRYIFFAYVHLFHHVVDVPSYDNFLVMLTLNIVFLHTCVLYKLDKVETMIITKSTTK